MKKWLRCLGYNREEMIGRFIWDFASEEDQGLFEVKLQVAKKGVG